MIYKTSEGNRQQGQTETDLPITSSISSGMSYSSSSSSAMVIPPDIAGTLGSVDDPRLSASDRLPL